MSQVMYNWLDSKLNSIEPVSSRFKNNKPYPIVSMRNFLPEDIALDLYKENLSVPVDKWREFTRNGSHMIELNKLELIPKAHELVSYLHSSKFLNYLEQVTGIESLIPDPHIVGGGYSRSFTGDILQIHTDFNWNEQLKLHRTLSLIVYLTPDWKLEYGGGLNFYDKDRKTVIFEGDCMFNTALLWEYNKYGFHGYIDPISSPPGTDRTTFRLFYYTSKSTYDANDPPHRSLYWVDPNSNEPIDNKLEK